jgi:hypothetical protein
MQPGRFQQAWFVLNWIMRTSSLGGFLQQLQRDLEASFADEEGTRRHGQLLPQRAALDLEFLAERDPGGEWRFEPVGSDRREVVAASSPSAHHRLRIELEFAPRTTVPNPTPAPRRVESLIAAEPVGGDPSILRRQLELVLGGPPGFTTGARAEILADLLRDFDRLPLLEELRSGWVSQFDTGPSASSAVTKPPPLPPPPAPPN